MNIIWVDVVDEDVRTVVDFAETSPADGAVKTFLDRVVLWIPQARRIWLEFGISPWLSLRNNPVDEVLFLLNEVVLDLADYTFLLQNEVLNPHDRLRLPLDDLMRVVRKDVFTLLWIAVLDAGAHIFNFIFSIFT